MTDISAIGPKELMAGCYTCAYIVGILKRGKWDSLMYTLWSGQVEQLR